MKFHLFLPLFILFNYIKFYAVLVNGRPTAGMVRVAVLFHHRIPKPKSATAETFIESRIYFGTDVNGNCFRILHFFIQNEIFYRLNPAVRKVIGGEKHLVNRKALQFEFSLIRHAVNSGYGKFKYRFFDFSGDYKASDVKSQQRPVFMVEKIGVAHPQPRFHFSEVPDLRVNGGAGSQVFFQIRTYRYMPGIDGTACPKADYHNRTKK